MNSVRKFVITGFCVAIGVMLFAYYVFIPAWTHHSDAARLRSAEQMWAEAHSKSLRMRDLVVAKIGPYSLTSRDVYFFYMSTRQSQSAMESALRAPNASSFEDSYSGLVQSLALMVGASQKLHMSIPPDLSGYIREQLSPFSDARPSNWSVAMMKARANHLSWESEVDWIPSFVAAQLAKRFPQVLQNMNKDLQAYRAHVEWIIPPNKALSLISST
ncbi:hypothetical protein [Alicyclobacillus mali (ex Roth et al. 2021)]|uniref:hypothetical protein n=1 Tax=Alicyclobacillus mali (ex Roth et al. 2021) TaxID=1123961 RepID=UPI00082CC444|nr:hypothetical protein [Alicyclobacillus mali (ex Roth et al. 2021)]MCL6489465.1 hypothetical protein [Alicyclobacillus mali (ex Roth et al. 2021)]